MEKQTIITEKVFNHPLNKSLNIYVGQLIEPNSLGCNDDECSKKKVPIGEIGFYQCVGSECVFFPL